MENVMEALNSIRRQLVDAASSRNVNEILVLREKISRLAGAVSSRQPSSVLQEVQRNIAERAEHVAHLDEEILKDFAAIARLRNIISSEFAGTELQRSLLNQSFEVEVQRESDLARTCERIGFSASGIDSLITAGMALGIPLLIQHCNAYLLWHKEKRRRNFLSQTSHFSASKRRGFQDLTCNKTRGPTVSSVQEGSNRKCSHEQHVVGGAMSNRRVLVPPVSPSCNRGKDADGRKKTKEHLSTNLTTRNLSDAFATPTRSTPNSQNQGILQVSSPEQTESLASSFPKPNGSHPLPSAPPERPKFQPTTSPIASESSERVPSELLDLTFSSRTRDQGSEDTRNQQASPPCSHFQYQSFAANVSASNHQVPNFPNHLMQPPTSVAPLNPTHSNPNSHFAQKRIICNQQAKHNSAQQSSSSQDGQAGAELGRSSASAFSRLQPSARKDKRKIADRARKAAAELKNAKAKEEEAQRRERALKQEKLQVLQMRTKSMLQKNLLGKFKKESTDPSCSRRDEAAQELDSQESEYLQRMRAICMQRAAQRVQETRKKIQAKEREEEERKAKEKWRRRDLRLAKFRQKLNFKSMFQSEGSEVPSRAQDRRGSDSDSQQGGEGSLDEDQHSQASESSSNTSFVAAPHSSTTDVKCTDPDYARFYTKLFEMAREHTQEETLCEDTSDVRARSKEEEEERKLRRMAAAEARQHEEAEDSMEEDIVELIEASRSICHRMDQEGWIVSSAS
eukprot:763356-Hanusia_phi.AAC.5